MESFQIAQSYFSDILNAQLVIFSLIITLLVAITISLYFIFVPKFTKHQIEERVEEEVKKLSSKNKEEIRNEYTKEAELIKKELDDLKLSYQSQFDFLQADIARSMALGFDNGRYPSGSFDWSIRAARYFSQTIGNDVLVRGNLNKAIGIIKNFSQLNGININMFNEHISNIDRIRFGLELDILENEIKRLIKTGA